MGDDSPAQSLFRQNATVYNAPHVAAGHAFNLQMNGNAPKPTLPSLLRAEAITGSTYERDLNTLRPDYLYFNPKNGYILVEDTSGEFQPAHAKEYHQRIYPKPGDEDRDTEWPTLWGGQEGRQAFYKASASYRPSLPSIELLISNERGCAPEPDRTVPVSSSKKQSTSQGSQVADPPSYLAASGNSQIITSNIQSATSTRSGQALGANGGKDVVRKVTDGFIVDKRLARLGSKNAHIVTIGAAHVQTSQNGSVSGELARRQLARANSGRAGAGDVVDFLQKKNARPVAPQPKKPGYCENCRVRFEDFKTVSAVFTCVG
jgi:regulatory subunit for Cdc7p protein kinase